MAERPIYRIVNWDETFENAGSRKVRRLSWVSIPNRHDSAGYRRLMDEPDGTALYGGWCLMVEVASKMPVRGVLHNGRRALTASDLAARTGGDEQVFSRLFELLVQEDVCWLENAGSVLPERPDVLPERRDMLGHSGATRHDTTRQDRISIDVLSHTEPTASNGMPSKEWTSLFYRRIGETLKLSEPRWKSEERPIKAVGRRLARRSDRDACARECVRMAGECVSYDNPAAGWQAMVNEAYPA